MSADLDDVEAKVKRVAEKASEWRGLKFGEKALILRECLAYLSAESEELSFDNISKNIAKVQKLSGNRGEEDSFMGALTFFDYW
jgi:RNA processing factor Prp31